MTIRLSLFHDLGKSRLPLRILNKRSPLTREERRILTYYPTQPSTLQFIVLNCGEDYHLKGFGIRMNISWKLLAFLLK
jgi:hypothetical protein